MLVHLGSLTLGNCVPIAGRAKVELDAALAAGLAASARLEADVGLVLPSLNAKLAAALKLQASLVLTPPSLTAQLEAALKLVAALEAAISLGLPGLSFQLAAVAKLIAQIQADIGHFNASISFAAEIKALLEASVDFSLDLGLLLGTPGIHAYQYTGAVRDLGDELAAATENGFPEGNGGDGCVAWIFAASDGGAMAAAQQAFATAA
jgi:hypothetical protein